ncbi:iron ABC transporter ATP-binding protein [Sphingobacterium lactis]|uniref:Iron complex transport system ATP-binding protein n=1 Tax=Sphingobacterium lactis TaxID=797291 RepID=A0A1H5YZP1_9SPHI|nr:ATP-binding cassette domain-containing protein [Sphingobacterium lactis]SEG28865.1 iron complex transport system ATP-binding protein [Sphingobacterium lactis]
MIKISGVRKSYGKKITLENINLMLPKGKVIALIGPNGAGKSTLLSLIARLEKPDYGTIHLEGQNTASIPLRTFSKKLSFLKQQNVYDLKLRVSELIAFGRFPHSEGKITQLDRDKIEEVISLFDLSDIRNSFIDQISGGQRQRVFLAMIIAQDTDYILLDEPLNNLDMKHSRAIMALLSQLAHEFHKTIITVVHDINFAANFSDYCIAMKNGEIHYFDETRLLIRKEVLEALFDMEFEVISNASTLLCNYFYKTTPLKIIS